MTCSRKEKLNIFEEKTTYLADYKPHKLTEIKRYRTSHPHTIKERPFRKQSYVPITSDTLQAWKCVLPFDALWSPKPITRTHPYETFDPDFKPDSSPDTEIIKTRPRVYMLPEVSMDDIEDPKIRKLIVDNMYTTDWKMRNKELNHTCTKRGYSNTVLEDAKKIQCKYEYDMVKTFPKDWLDKCKEWEKNYPDHVVNQTELFWETFKYPNEPIPAGEYTLCVPEETRKEIRDLIDEEKLRMPLDKLKSGYSGYRPVMDTGPLKNKWEYENPYKQLIKKEFES